MADPFVVVGGDAAGLSAASKFARERPESDVIVFEKGQWVSYAHCGTPYYVKGEVEHLTDLLALRPEAITERGIDLRRSHEVVDVDTAAQRVTVASEGETFDQPYSDLLVATGARAATDPFPGTDLDGVFSLHGLDDAAAIRAAVVGPGGVDTGVEFVDAERVDRYAGRPRPETVAIVGGGYVGVEMAEAFSAHDLDVHLFQRSGALLPPFGGTVGDRTAETLRDNGVTVHLAEPVERLVGDDAVEAVVHDGERTAVDVALVGVGIRPNVDLVAEAAIETGESGAIAVDEYGRTTAENVFAAGDCAEDAHAVTGDSTWVPLGLTANRAGRAIGQTVAGDPSPIGDVAGTAVVKAFDLECGRTGLLEDQARATGYEPVSATITADSRSSYYPGGDDTDVTLVADRDTGRLLGGAIAGRDRAAVRIDTVATALEADLTAAEVERLDLAYAPPFSPVWDPVLVAAKVLNGTLASGEDD